MGEPERKTVVLILGLPYTGKTALIHRIAGLLPGETIYIDGVFRDIVPESEVCLDRWLSEQPRFVDRIADIVAASGQRRIYVELGIMQKVHRTRLVQMLRAQGFDVVPVLLRCTSRSELASRQLARQAELARGPDKLKIAIGLDELFGRIHAVFQDPGAEEGFHEIDTALPIERSLGDLMHLVEDRRSDAPPG